MRIRKKKKRQNEIILPFLLFYETFSLKKILTMYIKLYNEKQKNIFFKRRLKNDGNNHGSS